MKLAIITPRYKIISQYYESLRLALFEAGLGLHTLEDVEEPMISHHGGGFGLFYRGGPKLGKDRDGTSNDWNTERFKLLAKLRNDAIREALEHKPEWVAIIDDDIFLNPLIFKKLLSLREEYKAVGSIPVSVYWHRILICDYNFGQYYERNNIPLDRDIFKLPKTHWPDQIWFVRREVLERLGDPWVPPVDWEMREFARNVSAQYDWYILAEPSLCDFYEGRS